jgi:hypothetical protein
MPSGHYSNIIL